MALRRPSNLNFSMIFYFSGLGRYSIPRSGLVRPQEFVHLYVPVQEHSQTCACTKRWGALWRSQDLFLAARRAVGSMEMASGSCQWSGSVYGSAEGAEKACSIFCHPCVEKLCSLQGGSEAQSRVMFTQDLLWLGSSLIPVCQCHKSCCSHLALPLLLPWALVSCQGSWSPGLI